MRPPSHLLHQLADLSQQRPQSYVVSRQQVLFRTLVMYKLGHWQVHVQEAMEPRNILIMMDFAQADWCWRLLAAVAVWPAAV